MLNLSEIDQSVLLARGEYSTVRSAHEDSKKRLQILCGSLSSLASQILRKMQPDSGLPEDVVALIDMARVAIDEIEVEATLIESLARQRAGLKSKAWS